MLQAIAMYNQNTSTPLIFTSKTFLQFTPSPITIITNPPNLQTILTTTSQLTIDLTDSFTLDGISVAGGGWEWEWDWDCFVPREGNGERGGGVCEYEGGEVVEMPGRGEGRFVGGGEGVQFEIGVPLYFVVRVRVREREGGRVLAEGRYEEMFSVVGERGNRRQEGENLGLVVEESEWVCDEGAFGYSVSKFGFFLNF